MAGLLRLFATGADQPPLTDAGQIERLYWQNRVRIMIAITLGYSLAYTCRLALSVVKKPLIDDGIFTPTELGLIGSALFYTYGFGKLVNGFFADHSNMKVFFAFGVLVSALLNIAMGFTTAVTVAVILWGLNGWFQGFGAPAGVVAMTNWFSNRERGRIYGIWSTAHSMGEALTFVVVAAMVATLGWRFGFIGPGLICIAAAAGIYWLMQDRPRTLGLPEVNDWRGDRWQQESAADKAKSLVAMQFSILRIPAVWVLALSASSIYVTRYAINSWGILYLQETHGYGLVEAGSFLFVSTLAGIAGCVGYGFISDKLFDARRPPANLLFAVVEIIGLLLIFYGPQGPFALTCAFILYGLGLNGLVTALGGLFAVDVSPKRAAGAVMGVIGIFSYVGAAVQENISGYLIQRGMEVAADGVRVYDFGPVTWFWLGSSVISMLLAATLWRVRLRD